MDGKWVKFRVSFYRYLDINGFKRITMQDDVYNPFLRYHEQVCNSLDLGSSLAILRERVLIHSRQTANIRDRNYIAHSQNVLTFICFSCSL